MFDKVKQSFRSVSGDKSPSGDMSKPLPTAQGDAIEEVLTELIKIIKTDGTTMVVSFKSLSDKQLREVTEWFALFGMSKATTNPGMLGLAHAHDLIADELSNRLSKGEGNANIDFSVLEAFKNLSFFFTIGKSGGQSPTPKSIISADPFA